MKRLVLPLLLSWGLGALPVSGQVLIEPSELAEPSAPAFMPEEPTSDSKVNDWQTVFFKQPERALPLLTASAVGTAPALRSMELEKAVLNEDLQLARQNILNSIALGGTYNYGNLASIQLSDPNSPNQFTTYSSGRYSIGANVSVPLDRFVGRRHLINKERLHIARAESVRQEREAAVRQQVIQLYYQVLLAKKVLTIHQQSVVTAQINQQLAEKNFQRGQISMADLSAANEQFAQANIASETAASEYTTVFLTLESVTGAKISTLMISSR